jgi:hypothetical protein
MGHVRVPSASVPIGPSSARAAGKRAITETIVTGRIGGYSAMLGGICWMVAAWFAALSPPYGSAGNITNRFVVEDAWLLAALPLLAIAVGSVVRIHRENSPTGVRLGGALLVAGAFMATVSLGLEASSLVVVRRPLLEISAIVVLIPLGGALLAAGALRARVVSPVASTVLLVGAVLLLVANSENWMAGLAAVFGFGWLALGLTLVKRSGSTAPQPPGPSRPPAGTSLPSSSGTDSR